MKHPSRSSLPEQDWPRRSAVVVGSHSHRPAVRRRDRFRLAVVRWARALLFAVDGLFFPNRVGRRDHRAGPVIGIALLPLLLPTAAAAAGAPERGVNGGGHGPPFVAVVRAVDPGYAKKMQGVSWRPDCPVPIEDLRVITMTHRGFDGRVHIGRLMVNEDVVSSVLRVFRRAYEADFPIRRMELIENYGGSDDASMAADNTSAFNCRNKTGSTTEWSIHSYGRAIDINTVENPYVRGDTVLPPAGRDYLDRTDVRPGMIVDGDVVTTAFAAEGFEWGGDWVTLKDYQHFERTPEAAS